MNHNARKRKAEMWIETSWSCPGCFLKALTRQENNMEEGKRHLFLGKKFRYLGANAEKPQFLIYLFTSVSLLRSSGTFALPNWNIIIPETNKKIKNLSWALLVIDQYTTRLYFIRHSQVFHPLPSDFIFGSGVWRSTLLFYPSSLPIIT